MTISGRSDCRDPEIWGGFECSIVRIRDEWRNQIVETGHDRRIDDIDRLAALGIRTMRYPLLWEMAVEHPDFWTWADERLLRLQRLQIRPVIGLVHHGSGPAHVDLLSREFATGLAQHAGYVARRYPWVDAYTPVNEPLTTARFSALYGHWYPHHRDRLSFVRAVFHQCLAIILSMREIRRVRPDAILVQTEDLGRTFSTDVLAAQADHENERRWLSLDLLCGCVGKDHPFYPVLHAAGVSDRDLAEFHDEDNQPDMIGINHYLTSDRYLDHRLAGYPPEAIGGNETIAYADVAAARARVPKADWGPHARLMEAWERYQKPIAVTEAHNGADVAGQLRWIETVHRSVVDCLQKGADVRAMTAWACFGAVDWPSLLTRREGMYESGLFDTRHEPPQRTALADVFKDLAHRGACRHPLLDEAKKGWWDRADRYHRKAKRIALRARS